MPTQGTEGGQKACTRCDEVKPLDAYSRKRASADGRQSWCKACFKDVQQQPKHRAAAMERARRQRLLSPEARKAHRKLQYAVECGRMERGACEGCGSTANVDGHHHRGYDRPYDVQWLCRACHVAIEPRRGVA